MKDHESGWVEPDITINGQKLSFQEAMTVRVACASMHLQMHSAEARKNLGAPAGAYVLHLETVQEKIFTNLSDDPAVL